jgi:DNA-binding transcriptional MerR regulator
MAGKNEYSIGVTARLSGLSEHTLRKWEEQFEAVAPARTRGGDRRYTNADLQRLALLSGLVDEGHRIEDIAGLEDARLQAMTAKSRPAGAPGSAMTGMADRGLPAEPPEQKFERALLKDIAMMSGTIACECPQHVARLLLNLSDFEAYSEECQLLQPADIHLHRMLQITAATARSLLENALIEIAEVENIDLGLGDGAS